MTPRRVAWLLVAAVGLAAVVVALGLADDPRLFALDAQTGRPRWSAALPLGTRFVGNPAVADGRVLVGTAGRRPLVGDGERWTLSAFEADGGRPIWQFEPPARPRVEAVSMALTTPYLTADHAFLRFETIDGASLLVVDAASGRTAWSADHLAFGRYSRHTDLVAVGDLVLVPTLRDGQLTARALRTSDGTEVWAASLGPAEFPRSDLGPFLAADPSTFYVGLPDGIVALDTRTGARRFRAEVESDGSGGQLVLADGTLYRRSGLYTIDAFDPATGAHRWSYRPPFEAWRGALRSFSVGGGLLAAYCACDTEQPDRSGWLLAVDAASGAERWRTPMAAYLDLYQDMPLVAGGIVVSGSEDDDVVARSAEDGRERWRFPRERGQLAAGDGRLIFVTDLAPRWRHWLALLGVPAPT